jgi:hypothetical protein
MTETPLDLQAFAHVVQSAYQDAIKSQPRAISEADQRITEYLSRYGVTLTSDVVHALAAQAVAATG